MITKRITELDGVRGLAILQILVWHYVALVPVEPRSPLAYFTRAVSATWSGVDLFFVLSGFLIGGILLDQKNSPNYFSTFYRRRFFRIVPLYAVMVAVVYLLRWAGLDRTDYVLLSPLWYLSFTQNIWMVLQEQWTSFWLGQTWSLAVEEQFYLLIPAIIWFVPRKFILRVLVILALAAPVIRTIMFFSAADPSTKTYVLLPCRMDALLFGVIVAVIVRDEKWRIRMAGATKVVHVLFGLSLFCLAVAVVRNYSIGSPYMATVGYTMLALLYSTFLILAMNAGPIQQICRIGWLRQLGIWAYCLYLIHAIIPHYLMQAAGANLRLMTGFDWLIFSAAVAMVFVVAHLSWRYFERPLIERGHRFAYRRKATA